MKNTFMVIPFVLLLCCIAGCQQGERVLVETKANVGADIQAIRNIIEEWKAAINTSDIENSMLHRADDEVSIPPNMPARIGKEANRNSLIHGFEQFTYHDAYDVKDINVGGDLAVAHVTYTTIATPKAGGEPTEHNGNWIVVFKKQPEGTWNCIYMIWSDESLVSPTQAE
jgi:ketosteroid isomerase-like protein